MGLGRDLLGHLMRENDLIFLDDFGGQLGQSIVLSLEGSATLLSAGIHTEDHLTVLVCVAEGMESSLALFVIISISEHVTTMSEPGGLRGFVVKESARESLTELLPSEPLEHVGFLSLTNKLSGGPLGAEVVHGVGPGLTRVGIELPSVLLLGSCPVGDGETLEHGSRLTVETDITYALEESGRVEMLSIQVEHDIGFLVEFVAVNILDTHAGFASFLDMESVGNKEEVRVDEFSNSRGQLFSLVARGKDELNPALVPLLSDVVFEGARTNLSFSEETAVYHSV